MNKFLSTLTPFVGAKPLTFVVAFSGLAVLLVLPSRHGDADWSDSLDGANHALPTDGSAPVSSEAPDAVAASATPATSGSTTLAHEGVAQSGEQNRPIVLVVSPLANDRRVEFARETETSFADGFGHTSRSDQAATRSFGSGIGTPGGASAPIASSGVAGGGSSGASAAAGGNAGASSPAVAGERAHDATQTSAKEAAARSKPQAAPLADTVPDPSPVVQDPIPLANSPAPAVHSSAGGEADDHVTTPANSGETDHVPFADNGLLSFGDTSAGAADGVAALPTSPGAVNPLAVPGLNDLPTAADVKPAELAPVSRVPDSGRSLVLLTGALLGLFVFRRWQSFPGAGTDDSPRGPASR